MLDHGSLIFRGTRDEIETTEDRRVQQFWRGEAD